MPIGKNSIKRVTNNGYTNAKSQAPDMENSVVSEIEKKAEPALVTEKLAPKKKTAPKSTAQKKQTQRKPAPQKAAPKITEDVAPGKEVAIKAPEKAAYSYVNIGGELPIYLL